MVKTNCFAYNETEDIKQQCCALVERVCNNENCKFYKMSNECDNTTIKLVKEQKRLFKKAETKDVEEKEV